MVVQEVLVGIDIGLIALLAFTCLQWRRLKAKRRMEQVMLESITEAMQASGAVESTRLPSRIRAKLQEELPKRYAPLDEVLGMEVKIVTVFLIVYNLFLIIFYLMIK